MSDVIMSGETGKLKFLAESRGILGHSGEIMPENTKYISYENYKKVVSVHICLQKLTLH